MTERGLYEKAQPQLQNLCKTKPHTHTYVYIHTHTFFFKIAPKINHMTTKKKKTIQNSQLRGMPEYSCPTALSIKLHVTTGGKKKNKTAR